MYCSPRTTILGVLAKGYNTNAEVDGMPVDAGLYFKAGVGTGEYKMHLFRANTSSGGELYHQLTSGDTPSTSSWSKVASNYPAFYKNYADLSSLASAMGVISKFVPHDKIYTSLTGNMSTAIATKILKEICIQKPGIHDALHVGSFDAGISGAYFILCYNTSKLNNDGVPQYAWGISFTGDYLAVIRSYDYTVSVSNVTLT